MKLLEYKFEIEFMSIIKENADTKYFKNTIKKKTGIPVYIFLINFYMNFMN
jgi:hypothetical protein